MSVGVMCSVLFKRIPKTFVSAHEVRSCYISMVANGTQNPNRFHTVKTVKPAGLGEFFRRELKLQFVKDDVESTFGVELLRNIALNYDFWIVRTHHPLLYYYRLEMLMQRIKFLQSVGLDQQQKYRHVQKYPPALIYSFDSVDYDANLVYLRGLITEEQDKFTHIFYPLCTKITLSRKDIEDRMAFIEKELNIKQFAVIREILTMPCFFLDPEVLKSMRSLFVHKFSMPFQYDVYKHSVQIMPPVCNLPKLNLKPEEYFSNRGTVDKIRALPVFRLGDVLTYSYSSHNGVATPECLSEFLKRAEYEEHKDRTYGQQVKGRRGFNVAPRQY